jgi:mRNA-degrading endonuclease toxin of MazEF toxin-antitoxin module
VKRGELWWADLGNVRPLEQTGKRSVVVCQSAHLAGTAVIEQSESGPQETSVALAFQLRAVPKACLTERIRALTESERAELELATDEALGRAEPEE